MQLIKKWKKKVSSNNNKDCSNAEQKHVFSSYQIIIIIITMKHITLTNIRFIGKHFQYRIKIWKK